MRNTVTTSRSADESCCYVLRTLSDGPAFPTPDWLDWAMDHLLCRICRRLKPVTGCVNADVEGIVDSTAALNFVRGFPFVEYGKRSFLALFGDWLNEGAYVGRLVDVYGTELREYATYVARGTPVILRGGPSSEYKGRCSACGQVVYKTIGSPLHTMRVGLAGRDLWVLQNGSLMVSWRLFSRVDRKRWKKLSVAKVRIVDEPLDGYPAEL